jgi:response regulator RpfG family c-di-GMP phosphodiesterase
MMRRILVLEDDEDIASALARGLSREGYEPVVAHDFAEAEAALAASEVDAALIDVMLGEDDGRTMVRRLRSRGLRAPIVLSRRCRGSRTARRGSTPAPTTMWRSPSTSPISSPGCRCRSAAARARRTGASRTRL